MAFVSLRLLLIAALMVSFCQLTANASRRRPRALVTPISEDPVTLRYTFRIGQRTPMRVLHLMIDIEQDYTWLPCTKKSYISSTYRPVACNAPLCKSYEHSSCATCYAPRGPGCNNHTCAVPKPGVQLGQDAAALLSSDGRKSGPIATFSRVAFACAAKGDLSTLPQEAAGVAGMSSSALALPAQLAAAGGFSRKFAMCLTDENSDGFLFFGDGPLVFFPLNGATPGRDLSRHLIRTPLIENPIYNHAFYIGVQRIEVNGVRVPIATELLRINAGGRGGTKLSTVVRYTQLATPIYKSLAAVFTKMAKQMNISRVASVAPFGACFDTAGIGGTDVGFTVPTIDLVLEGNATPTWRIFGSNSMVEINNKVVCLGFVDAGEKPGASIVLGTYQMQQNLVQFDIARSTFGISSNLLSLHQQTRCSNFNMTDSLEAGIPSNI